MLGNFIENGSIIGLMLLIYASTTLFEAVIRVQTVPRLSPDTLLSRQANIIYILAIPAGFWAAIYVGIYEGILIGMVSWIVLQLIGQALINLLSVRRFIGTHFYTATLAMFLGYYLTFVEFL